MSREHSEDYQLFRQIIEEYLRDICREHDMTEDRVLYCARLTSGFIGHGTMTKDDVCDLCMNIIHGILKK